MQSPELSLWVPPNKLLLKQFLKRSRWWNQVTITGNQDTTSIAVADRGYAGRDNEDWTKEVLIPGATSMEIEWDSQCRTESMLYIAHAVFVLQSGTESVSAADGCDWVRVFKDNDEQQTIYPDRLSGSSWPGVITVDNCESLSFKFHSDYSGNYWGFKVLYHLDSCLATQKSLAPFCRQQSQQPL